MTFKDLQLQLDQARQNERWASAIAYERQQMINHLMAEHDRRVCELAVKIAKLEDQLDRALAKKYVDNVPPTEQGSQHDRGT